MLKIMKLINSKNAFLLSLTFASILIFLLSLYSFAQQYQKGDLYMDETNYKKKNLKNIITEEQYHVTIDNGTEPPFRNAYWDNKKEGIYVDVISGEPLFISKNKFNSDTGWPSFTKPIDKEHIIEKADRTLGMSRTEVRSRKSNAHLGHVFNDGPTPTGQRYCINSAALRFIPADKLDQEGYTKYLELFNEGN
jgi:methionine-R-sulfoxide reductase